MCTRKELEIFTQLLLIPLFYILQKSLLAGFSLTKKRIIG